ncbi:methyl-accepting chemotaxis protein [Agrobacterium tumefaciens]|uniref:methyl-accepting chemotaxis protein n=1 Tax=Agrobacterium tumefaciens TaxID=358 RepID=UPI00080FDB67|nr:methyl-accepting chemotaxis protein [Agrobacterium tumefaciens]NTB04481.1 methyl-accepting chemotaxis protein [Agrobacterium tumefaciens]OCJ64241.1 chemotaxis protein [Agrobacterium tumefaciens]
MLFKSTTGRNIFAVAACGVFATIAASAVLFYRPIEDTRANNLERMRQIAHSEALATEKNIGGTIHIVNSLVSVLESMKQSGDADRGKADQIIHQMLANNPDILGLWTGWEPNAFDGKDAEFANREGHDATGRYIPYWVRSGGKIGNTALTDYATAGPADYYQLPFTLKKTVVVEPYSYAIDGKEVLITSIAKPVMVDGKPQGVAGLDLSLDETSKALSAVRPMGTGFVSLVSGGGKIISHPDAAIMGKSLADGGAKTAGWDQLIANPGAEREITAQDGTASFAIALPVMLTQDMKWYAIISVPEETVFAQLHAMMRDAALTIVTATVLLALAGWFIARRFIGRIANIIDETAQIAQGNLHLTLKDIGTRDEIGDLARSLDVLRENNRQKASLEQEAETNRTLGEEERAARERRAADEAGSIRFAVDSLAYALAKLADGDLSCRIDNPFVEQLDAVRGDFNGSAGKLQDALLRVSENASGIDVGANEIKSASDDLARRTEQQAAAVEETAAALEEITTTVKDAANRAHEAGRLVSRTRIGAERSGEVVRQAVMAMERIEKSSNEISSIIGVIDEIAFQTNLLALNAGVEAARAGEAGKGFAVVAQEVRELAQRSAAAAKEIKSLITKSNQQVEEGVHLVGDTGKALDVIVAEVQEINQHVAAIVESAQEQSSGLQQINVAVNQMDQETQKNAAMVEEMTAASHTLATEVDALNRLLGQFELGQGTSVHRGALKAA